MAEHEHRWLDVTTIDDKPGVGRFVCRCGASAYGLDPPRPSGPTLIDAFVERLKAHLRTYGSFELTQDADSGWQVIDFDALYAAIDAFAAEFQKPKR